MGSGLIRVAKATGWVVAIGAVAGVVWWRTSAPVPVAAVAPQRRPLVAEVFGTGTLEAKVVTGVSAKIVGKVVSVAVDQGDVVAPVRRWRSSRQSTTTTLFAPRKRK
jgi:multidrug efflux pump subunit AcrA (membrane-fusion protein)